MSFQYSKVNSQLLLVQFFRSTTARSERCDSPPAGVPVATVAVGNGRNAGILAVRILAVEDASLAQRLEAFRAAQAEAVQEKNAEPARQG